MPTREPPVFERYLVDDVATAEAQAEGLDVVVSLPTKVQHCKECDHAHPVELFRRFYTAKQAVNMGYGEAWSPQDRATMKAQGVSLPQYKRIPHVHYQSSVCKGCRPQAVFIPFKSTTDRLNAATLGGVEGETRDSILAKLERERKERKARAEAKTRGEKGFAGAHKKVRSALLCAVKDERVAAKQSLYYAENRGAHNSGPRRKEYLHRYLHLVDTLEIFIELEVKHVPTLLLRVYAYMPEDKRWCGARLLRLAVVLLLNSKAAATLRKRAEISDRCRGAWLFEEAVARPKPSLLDDLFEPTDIVAQAEFEYGAVTGRTREVLAAQLRGRATRGKDSKPRTRRTRDQIKADKAGAAKE
jgi:hypothetical protein